MKQLISLISFVINRYVAKTGDTSNMIMFAILFGASVGVILAIILVRRQKRK